MARVAIVNMPFSNLRWPNIGPSLLKAGLARAGIACDVLYLNFDFAEQIGLEDYYWIADLFGFVLGGERLFSKHYFDGQLPGDEHYYRDVLLKSDLGFESEDARPTSGCNAASSRSWSSASASAIGRSTTWSVSLPPSSRPCLRSAWPSGSGTQAGGEDRLRRRGLRRGDGRRADADLPLGRLRVPGRGRPQLSRSDRAMLAGGPWRLPAGVAGRRRRGRRGAGSPAAIRRSWSAPTTASTAI